MIYPPGYDQMMIDEEQSSIDSLTAWLSDKSPDDWMRFVKLANLDTCIPVLCWMVEQPRCDRGVAAAIFWACDPRSWAEAIARGEDFTRYWDGHEPAQHVLQFWSKPPPLDSG